MKNPKKLSYSQRQVLTNCGYAGDLRKVRMYKEVPGEWILYDENSGYPVFVRINPNSGEILEQVKA